MIDSSPILDYPCGDMEIIAYFGSGTIAINCNQGKLVLSRLG
ncbi:hypothetical protein SGADD02_02098 [Streptococcus gallolyticus]|uniref:Uncharacterized protein n=1 Tax=Streptococcus gallolyticus TaxID=315405 RepID=A0A139MK66_9STRE|nr:hypothetical protein SGADD02_02098 [Streptococcus gallolyticus]